MGTNKIVHTEIKNFFTDEECSELIKDVIKFGKVQELEIEMVRSK